MGRRGCWRRCRWLLRPAADRMVGRWRRGLRRRSHFSELVAQRSVAHVHPCLRCGLLGAVFPDRRSSAGRKDAVVPRVPGRRTRLRTTCGPGKLTRRRAGLTRCAQRRTQPAAHGAARIGHPRRRHSGLPTVSRTGEYSARKLSDGQHARQGHCRAHRGWPGRPGPPGLGSFLCRGPPRRNTG